MMDAYSYLWSDSEDERRFTILEAFRTRDSSKMPRLLALLHTNTYSNRRHITRALESIGGDEAQRALIELPERVVGLMLGNVAKTVGRHKMIGVKTRHQSIINTSC